MRLLRFARNDENSRISKLCIIPQLTFFVIPQLDWGISSNRRHCEGAKRPKQSRSKFRSNIVQGLINEIASLRSQ
ncbi:MAG: hypothetical protein MSC50_06495 [Campylobacter sp.]|uniref:hypothetical protein n=1 Tax=Campylobacter sp. TaxID=205 RepID=UPI002AA6C5FA|nr:hypothetical protein [Campylobacter sp.]MCI6579902.1 hypothetical protein [Campylobacter sp.]